MTNILFICTANSCRSQMAEGLARELGEGRIASYSAGVRPYPLDPLAVEIVGERAIDISNQSHKGLDAVPLHAMHLIVTLCPGAVMKLPSLPQRVHRLHWNIDDPTRVSGSAEEVREAYRTVRDALEGKIKALLPVVERLPAIAQEQTTINQGGPA